MPAKEIIYGMLRNTARLSRMVWQEKKGLIIALIIFFLLISSAPFLRSSSRGLLVNELISIVQEQLLFTNYLFLLIGFLIFATIYQPVVYTIINYLSKIFWIFLEARFETLIIQKKGELDIAVHEDPKHKDLFNKISENGTWRARSFIDRQFYIFQNIIEVIIASVVLIFSQWWVFVLIFIGTLPELIVESQYGEEIWSIHSGRAETKRKYWHLHNHFDRLPSLVEIRLFQNARYFLSIIKDLFKSFQLEEMKNERVKLFNELFVLIFSQVFIAFAVIYFVWQVVKGNLQVGTLTFILASITDFRLSLSNLFTNLGRQYQDSLFVGDIFKLLDIKPTIGTLPKAIKLDPRKTPEIVFDNITFAYPGTNKIALKNFSLKIAPGEKLAIVGANGAGKTTFVKLLCRFYDPDKGRIMIDGYDLKKVGLESWYDQLGALFQDYARYHFTVEEAVAVGRTGKKPLVAKVKEAAKASEADVFIGDWEKKYKQMLGKEFTGGVEPSIGQWQKLALARVFYRDPRVLILDEPTSSIDAESEAKIFAKLESLPSDRTVILISHRFSTVRQANRIAVISHGQLKELGTHEELLELNGIYARLFRLQAKGYK